jgi:hypothetical protein
MRCPRPLLIQTLIFPKAYFEAWDVFAWLDEQGFSSRNVEETRSSYRARQHEPSEFEPSSFRTISMGQGKSLVRAVIGCPSVRLFARVERQRHGLRKATYRPPSASHRKRRS